MATRGKLSLSEKAYIAGFVDGEGCVGIYKKKSNKEGWSDTYQLYIGITNTKIEVLNWLQDKIGGHICTKKRNNPKAVPAYTLQLRGWHKVLSVIEEIKPYLIVKQEQAKLMEDFMTAVTKLVRKAPKAKLTVKELSLRDSFYQKTKELNSRGIKDIAAATTKSNDLARGSDSLNLQETARGKQK